LEKEWGYHADYNSDNRSGRGPYLVEVLPGFRRSPEDDADKRQKAERHHRAGEGLCA
jgi:hypothetical protein